MEWTLVGALAIGLSLGLLGSGGSILTVPVLLYLAGKPEKLAIAESLAIVGCIAAAGAVPYALRGWIDRRSVVWFGLPGMLGAYAGAAAAAWIPGTVQLTAFAAIMLVAAVFMARPPRLAGNRAARQRWKIVLDGALVGVVTGIVGVGGGFLIVPALVLLGGLTMQRAVGTSLAIIAMNAASGFLKYREVLAAELRADAPLIATVAGVGILGAWVGNRLGSRLPRGVLQRVFAGFLILMALWILWERVPELLDGSGLARRPPVTRAG